MCGVFRATMRSSHCPCMNLSHLLLALTVVFVWGTNFVVIRWGLDEFPPFLLAALRFFLAAVPWMFFMPRPAASWGRLAAFGLLLGVGQFGLLYYAMRADLAPGLASLVMQSQVFFTIGAAVIIAGERVRLVQGLAVALAVAGIALIGWQIGHDASAMTTPWGLALALVAAACWAAANLVVRGAGKVNALAFIVWSSLFCVPVLLGLSWVFDGPAAMAHSLTHATWVGWSSVLWQSIGNMLFAFASWNWLLARYPAATITPMALLVPVFGMSSSALLLGEPLPGWKLLAAALVVGGLGLNVWASRAAMPSR